MNVKIISGYRPGAIGRITELHARYYSVNWNFGLFFEAKVASEFAEFCKKYNPEKDGLWLAMIDERIEGAIAIVGTPCEEGCARLRWFIVSPNCQGQRVGTRLMEIALDFCRAAGFRKIFLTTFAGLDSARHLYEKFGFVLIEENDAESWGTVVHEQVFEKNEL